ncbi:MAG: EF-P lysine aminoacylase EpmA [Pseudomonadota bacterium]
MWLRAKILHSIRKFFAGDGYLEIETPHLIPAPAPEAHIDAFCAGHWYLHTSPELCMKRLLSASYSKIFQICRVFRQGERGDRHLPEFTLLEWYRTGSDYLDLMDECEEMICTVADELGFRNQFEYQGYKIDIKRPWLRLSVQEAFERYASLSMKEACELGRFDEVVVGEIEPCLGLKRPVYLYDYPTSLASLARIKVDEPGLSERFELYLGGLEIANAFSELTEAQEQEARFEAEQKRRQGLGKECYPMPERFLEALSRMPAAAGIALGLDRLIMIFCNRARIEDVVSFTPEEL